jgi:hypothetical protein
MPAMASRTDDLRRQRLLPVASALLLLGCIGIATAVDVHRRRSLLSGLAEPVRFGPLEVRPPEGWSVRVSRGNWLLPGRDRDALILSEPATGMGSPRTIVLQVLPVSPGTSPDKLLDVVELPGNVLLEERWRHVPLAGGGGYLLSFLTAGSRDRSVRKFILVAGVLENRLGVTLVLEGPGRPSDDDMDLLVRLSGALSLDRNAR